ncbi:MAG: type III-A CRISPR-associated RAMP protein Csm3 [Candidatus Calescibacterium sp.]|nr:type III-A CRISPR-associated RAMP protein Csm3 [Candidatus Calescibacterium sp.]MDW8133153.1 type III-A CRISPR-associated RAMP protein Csm3 [Candidatus Calescibacterium sp.]
MSKVSEIKLAGKYIISGQIELLTGLHIGTSKDTMKIGDLDNPVIKDAFGKPYIPGSSLKGKMRSLMEYYHSLISPHNLVYSKR